MARLNKKGSAMTTNELHVVWGTGPAGQAIAKALLRRGHRVRMINRSGRSSLPGVEVVAGDAYDPTQVAALSAGATVVYQAAQPAYHKWASDFPPLQHSMITGAARSGARLAVVENLYMYGAVDGPIHEGLPYAAHTRKGQVRARMAEALQAAHRNGTLPTVSVRGSDFYGPGVVQSALGERVFAAAIAGKPAEAISRLDVPHSYTYIDDVGEALVRVAASEQAYGRAWHVPNAAPLTQRELLALLFAELGTAPQSRVVSGMALRVVGLFVPGAREMIELLYEFQQPFIVDSSAYVAAFGDHATPIRQGLRQTIAWYRQRAAPVRAGQTGAVPS
jgi:nucleoside-diphosphate-sugar epimerase